MGYTILLTQMEVTATSLHRRVPLKQKV